MTPLGDPRIAEVFYTIVGGVMAAAIAGEALGDVVDEPGGSILCDYRSEDWWADQPSIIGGPTQPVSPTWPAFQIEHPAAVYLPTGGGGGGRGLSRGEETRQPGGVPTKSPAPVPLGGIGALFAGLLAGIAIAWRLRR